MSFCHLKTLEKCVENVNVREVFVGFEKACSRANTYVILTSLNYVHFYELPD